MAIFVYTAKRKDGEVYKQEVEADDRFGVYALVRKDGSTIMGIEEKRSSVSFARWFERANELFSTIKESEKIIFVRNLGTMVQAGLPLSRALSVIERQTKNKKLRSVLTAVNRDVTKGLSFHEALGKHEKVFPRILISMARAGEESGQLAEALFVVAQQLERAYTLKKKVRGALIYPIIIVIAMVAIGILMLIYVVPTLSQTFKELNADLPTSTQIIIGVSDFIAGNILISLLGLLGVLVAFVAAARTKQGMRALDAVFIRIPIIGELVREVNAARTTRTLASLLSAGVPVIESLSITENVLQNSYYKEVLHEAQARVQKGNPFAGIFIERSDIYPVMVGEMMAVGEETGQLSSMLEQIADFYEEDVSQRTKDLSTVIEPFLMLIIGSVVGFFAVSMIAPIYSISNAI